MMKGKNQRAGTYIFFSVFVIIVGVTFFINLTRIGCYNSDAVVDMNYVQLVWEQKSIFPDGWYFTTETFIHRPFIFPVLLYGLTENFLLSYAGGIIAGALLFSVIAYGWFRFLELSKAVIFFGLCCLWTLFLHWVFMFNMFGYYYSGIFGSIMLTIWAYQSGEKWLRYMAMFSAFMMGLASLRMVVFLYVPLLALGLIGYLKSGERKTDISEIVFSMKLLLSNVFGYLLLCHVLKKHLHINWGTSHLEHYASVNEYLEAVAVTGQRVYEVLQLAEPVMFMLVLTTVLWSGYFFSCGRGQNRRQALLFFLLSGACIFGASCILKGMNIAPRYYVSITFFVILALMFLLDEIIKKHSVIAVAVGLVLVLFGTYNTQGHMLKAGLWADEYMVADSLKNDDSELFLPIYFSVDESEVAKYLMEQNIGRVYATFWNAEPIKMFSRGSIEAGHFDQNLSPYLWGTNRSLYEPGGYEGRPVAVVVRKDEVDSFSEEGKRILQQGRFMKEIRGTYMVYLYDANPILLR